jgi:hypothetical protein
MDTMEKMEKEEEEEEEDIIPQEEMVGVVSSLLHIKVTSSVRKVRR